MRFCSGTAVFGISVSVLCFVAVYAFSDCRGFHHYRNYPYQKMLTEVIHMKVVVMRSPKAFAWLFRLIFGVKTGRV